MKEVREFESAAAKIWVSQTSVADKQAKMAELSETIEHYVLRCKQALAQQGEGSEFQRKYIERAIVHLESLSRDCREVAGVSTTKKKKAAATQAVVQQGVST